MPIQKRFTLAALAKNTGAAKGSAAAAPTFEIGVFSGAVGTAEVQEEDLNPTFTSRVLEGSDRKHVIPGAAFDFLATPKTLGLLLYGAAGAVTTTGTGPYTHTIKTGDTLPYLTAWGRNASEYHKVDDALVDTLELSWDTTGALRGKTTIRGLNLSFLASAYTAATVTERPKDGLLKGVGGTFQIDGAGATIKSGTIRINNNLAAVLGSDSTVPKDLYPAMQTCDVSLTVVPDNLTLFRQVITGTGSGTTIQATSEYGTATIKHVLDASNDLTWTFNRLRFLSDLPGGDPAGGAQEVVLEGTAMVPSGGGDSWTAVLKNQQASY